MNKASSLVSRVGSRRAGRLSAGPCAVALAMFAMAPQAANAALMLGDTDQTPLATRGAFVFQQQAPDGTLNAGACDIGPLPAETEFLEAGVVPHSGAKNSGANLNNVAFPNLDQLGPKNGPNAAAASLETTAGLNWLVSSIDGRSSEPAVRRPNIPALDRFRARISNIDRCQNYLRFLLRQINEMLFSTTQNQGRQTTYRYLVSNPVLFAIHNMNARASANLGSSTIYAEHASTSNLSNTNLGTARNTIAGGSRASSGTGASKKPKGKTYRDKKITIKEVIFEIISRTYIYFIIIIIATIALFLRYRVR